MAPPASRILESPCPPSRDPGTVLFETERLIVRRYHEGDAQALADISNFTEISDFLTDRFPSPYTLQVATEFLNNVANRDEAGYPTQTAILVKPSTAENPLSEPRLIGGIGAEPMDNVFYRTWDLGYYLTPSAWGKGYMTEALSAFVRWTFATWPQLNRIDAQAFGFNPGSVRVLQRAGFREEGRRVEAAEKNGKVTDIVQFGFVRRYLEETDGS